MRTKQGWGLCALALAAACGGGGDSSTTADMSVTQPTRIEEIPRTSEPLALGGLEGTVEAVRDTRGMMHIYGESLHDVMLAQGYLMARDRFPAMELVRRQVTGRLAEFGSDLDPTLVNTDILARWIGHGRNAERIYASLPDNSDEKKVLDAFAAGVNLFLADVRADRVRMPRGAELLNFIILNNDIFTDWTPVDTLAIGRYLSHALSYSADSEIVLSRVRAAAAAEFAQDASDPARAARAGLFQDIWNFKSAHPTCIQQLVSNTDARIPSPPTSTFMAQRQALSAASRFFANLDAYQGLLFGDREARGSNNWIVGGMHTASGFPVLANDPHLALGSPPLFWYAHLNTKRAGGTLDVQGLALMGVPGIILGYNDKVAWGVTTAYADVTDVYQESITPGSGGAADTVLFNESQVAIEPVVEHIRLANGATRDVTFERVPHHGLIVPTVVDGQVMPRTDNTALSVRWTGNDVSNELGAFLRLNLAQSMDEAKAAIEHFEVGAQNFVVITSSDMHWTQHARIPTRAPAAMTYDPATGEGDGPMFVLPGQGSHEWTGELSASQIPSISNPSNGVVLTANNDPTCSLADGNPLNDDVYLGWDYEPGYRATRIQDELFRMATVGGIAPEQMSALQGDSHSNVGADYVIAFCDAVDRAKAEAANGGTHPDLSQVVAEFSGTKLSKISEMADRLRAWSTRLQTPAAVEGDLTAQELEDSVATSIFNVTFAQFATLSLDDELDVLGASPGLSVLTRFLRRAFIEPETLATYDGMNVAIFDDMNTTDRFETRDERIIRAFGAASDWLEANVDTSIDEWQWGKLHTVRLGSLIPKVSVDALSIPSSDDTMFPAGFPRHSDLYAVDVGNYDVFLFRGTPPVLPTRFSYSSGAQQRLVVEMRSDGPHAWNALPGGQVLDSASPHFRDEAELWRNNEAPPIFYTEADILAHYEARETFTP